MAGADKVSDEASNGAWESSSALLAGSGEARSIWPVWQRGDVGSVFHRLCEHGLARWLAQRNQHLEAGRAGPEVAHLAVRMSETRRLGLLGGLRLIRRRVLVLVMAKVLGCSTSFVPAIRGRCCPVELQQRHDQQQVREYASHGFSLSSRLEKGNRGTRYLFRLPAAASVRQAQPCGHRTPLTSQRTRRRVSKQPRRACVAERIQRGVNDVMNPVPTYMFRSPLLAMNTGSFDVADCSGVIPK